jgi:hypothetical protein
MMCDGYPVVGSPGSPPKEVRRLPRVHPSFDFRPRPDPAAGPRRFSVLGPDGGCIALRRGPRGWHKEWRAWLLLPVHVLDLGQEMTEAQRNNNGLHKKAPLPWPQP